MNAWFGLSSGFALGDSNKVDHNGSLPRTAGAVQALYIGLRLGVTGNFRLQLPSWKRGTGAAAAVPLDGPGSLSDSGNLSL